MSEAQKNLIKLIVKEAVGEYVRESRSKNTVPDERIESKVPATGFMRLSQVLEIIPLGKTCWWEGVKTGRFPKPVKLSDRCTAWRVEDIKKLMASF